MNDWKTKVDDLDVCKLKIVPIDLKTISDVVSKEVVKNTKFYKLNTKVKVPNVSTLIHTNHYKSDKHNLRCW